MIFSKMLQITYANPDDLQDSIQINYKLRNTSITHKWVERVLAAQTQGYIIDDPSRFYGFGTIESQKTKALSDINNLVKILNQWISIDIKLDAVDEQDKLNQLHHVFEIEHGLLDQQNDNADFKKYLCDLNLSVHRCESIARGAQPRHVVTYFGLPKTEILELDDYWHFDPNVKFGTVYINYAEIGKTLYDLMLDNDNFIKPEAFQPFCHFSADFVVRFWNENNSHLYRDLQSYFNRHRDFFFSLGYTWNNLCRSVGSIPVADLEYDGDILKMLETRQFVKAVHFF